VPLDDSFWADAQEQMATFAEEVEGALSMSDEARKAGEEWAATMWALTRAVVAQRETGQGSHHYRDFRSGGLALPPIEVPA
jgi:hypothetical protein